MTRSASESYQKWVEENAQDFFPDKSAKIMVRKVIRAKPRADNMSIYGFSIRSQGPPTTQKSFELLFSDETCADPDCDFIVMGICGKTKTGKSLQHICFWRNQLWEYCHAMGQSTNNVHISRQIAHFPTYPQ